jgi:hypothetical protein
MSGLYNMVFGVNQLAGPLLRELGISHHDVPRFRDCFLSTEDTVVIYTRTGGGNREEFAAEIEVMRSRAGYLRDEDDKFDSTYALFHFAVPEAIKPHLEQAKANGWTVDPAKRWEETLAQLHTLKG